MKLFDSALNKFTHRLVLMLVKIRNNWAANVFFSRMCQVFTIHLPSKTKEPFGHAGRSDLFFLWE